MRGLEKLIQYKEIITIITFFLGGFFWLQAEFPNKSDLNAQVGLLNTNLKTEVGSLNCLLDSYMLLTQLQISVMETASEIQNLENEKQDLEGYLAKVANVDEDANMQTKMLIAMKEKLESDITEKGSVRKGYRTSMEEVNLSLKTNKCREQV